MVLRCLSCDRGIYYERDIGTCKKCHQEIKNQHNPVIDDLKAKVAFLRLLPPPPPPPPQPLDHHDAAANHDCSSTSPTLFFPDVMLVTNSINDDDSSSLPPDPIPAHKAILMSRSPVFKAMFENEMEERKTWTIIISDASKDTLRAFVNYLYTAEATLVDEKMGCDLLVLAEKYMVKYLKDYCEKFLVSKLEWENSLISYAFAHQYNAKILLNSALSLMLNNIYQLTKMEDYKVLVEKDPRLVVEIYEAYISSKVILPYD